MKTPSGARAQDSQPMPAAPQLPTLPGTRPLRPAGARRPRTEELEDEKTIERQNFPARKTPSRIDDELTPLPELPGEGALTVGSDPDLDDAWTLDLGLDASSWGSPDSASLPTLAAPHDDLDAVSSGTVNSEMSDEVTGEITARSNQAGASAPAPVPAPAAVITSEAPTLQVPVHPPSRPPEPRHQPPLVAPPDAPDVAPQTVEKAPSNLPASVRPRRLSTPRIESSFEVEALTGPGDPNPNIAPIVIEEAATFDIAEETRADPGPGAGFFEPMDDPDQQLDEIGFGPAGFGREAAQPGSGPAEEIRLDIPDIATHDPAAQGPDRARTTPDETSDALETQPMDLTMNRDGLGRRQPARTEELSRDPVLSQKSDIPSRNSDIWGSPVQDVAAPMSAEPVAPASISPASISVDDLPRFLLAELDREAPVEESSRQRLRRRISSLIEKARAAHRSGDRTRAVLALDLAVSEDPDSAITQKLIQLHRDEMCEIFQGYLGDAGGVPVMALGLSQLSGQNIDNRAAFLLSRIDGMLTIDELLDVSGMARVEAYRHLCVLVIKGILKIDT